MLHKGLEADWAAHHLACVAVAQEHLRRVSHVDRVGDLPEATGQKDGGCASEAFEHLPRVVTSTVMARQVRKVVVGTVRVR